VAVDRAVEVEDLLDEGVCLRSKSDRTEDTFAGDFDESDALQVFVGDIGEAGVDKIFGEDGALGDADANSCVSFKGLAGRISCGRSAMGRVGIWSASACSCNQSQTRFLGSARGDHVPRPNAAALPGRPSVSCHRQRSQRATEAMPLPISLSRSISTSIPMPYAGIRDFDGLEK
jgi:hypothetical protein